MKLMIVTPYFYPKMGGAEKYVYELSSQLVKKYNIDVKVICSNWDRNGNIYKEEFINDIKVYRLPYSFKVSSTPINLFWNQKLHSIIDKEKPDIINGHFPVPYIADLTARIACGKGLPFVLTYHNDLIGYNPMVKLLSKIYYYTLGFKTFDRAQRIIVTSEYYAKNSPYLKKYYQKLITVSPGVDVEKCGINRINYLRSKYDLKDEKIILFVGQLNKESQHKGLDYLIKAIKIVNNSIETKLIIVGKGDYIEYYKNLAVSQELSESVIFAGYVDDSDLLEYYNGSDVVVLPSCNRAEGFGMVLIEAQACGTPVIGTSVGGIPYAIKDGETGLLVPPKNSKMLAETMIKILSDPNLAKQMGCAGYERVKKKFTWEKSTRNFLEVLNEVLNE